MDSGAFTPGDQFVQVGRLVQLDGNDVSAAPAPDDLAGIVDVHRTTHSPSGTAAVEKVVEVDHAVPSETKPFPDRKRPTTQPWLLMPSPSPSPRSCIEPSL
jgi:hypothetical protein